MPASDLSYAAAGGFARLTIERPDKLNAMTYGMWSALPELVAQAEADPQVRVIVLSGAGERAFCAGADIGEFGENRDDAGAVRRYDDAFLAGCRAVAEASKPSVALIRGICFGGGFGLAMSCDIRLGREDARFRIPAARLGLGYAYDGVAALAARLGPATVADLMMSARIVAAAEALRLGILQDCRDEMRFEAEAGAYLERLAANAPLTLRAVKRVLADLARPEAARDRAGAEAAVAACFASADYREGQDAFREPRDPVFRGI